MCKVPSMTSFQRDIGFSWNCFTVLWSQKLRDTGFRNVPRFCKSLRFACFTALWFLRSSFREGLRLWWEFHRHGPNRCALFECRFPWGFHEDFILKNTTKFQVQGASGEILAVLVGSDALRFYCWNDFTVPAEGFSNHLIMENEARNMVDLDGWKFDFSRFLLLPPKIPKRSINFEGG